MTVLGSIEIFVRQEALRSGPRRRGIDQPIALEANRGVAGGAGGEQEEERPYE